MNALSTTLYELLVDNLGSRPTKVALIDQGRTVTYSELAQEVDGLAGYMSESGIQRGDRVGIHLRKGIAEVAAMLAVWKVGGVAVNINSQWTLEQLKYIADDCQVRLLVAEQRSANRLQARGIPESISKVLVNGKAPEDGPFSSMEEALQATPQEQAKLLDSELGLIIYTSGSTGRPKGVMLSHRNVVTGARSVARYLKLRESDRLISVLPYSFDAGLNQLTTMLLVGGTVVHQPVPMPVEIVNTIKEHKVTGFAAVPPIWNQVIRLLGEAPTELPDLRLVTNTGGKIPRNILEQMPAVLPGVDIYLMYGLTEAFRSTFLPPEKFVEKMGAMGKAIPGAEVFVVKDGSVVTEAGGQGELVHRGPLVSLGYWENPEATQEKIRPCPELAHILGDEKVVYSGDIVEIDADGDLWFVGRNDAMIKCSGFRLSPDEVEDLVLQSGIVREAVAFGVDVDDLGQAVHVALTPLDGFDEDTVMKHCRKVMPSYMVPAKLHVWSEELPRTASGKIAKREVIDQTLERMTNP